MKTYVVVLIRSADWGVMISVSVEISSIYACPSNLKLLCQMKKKKKKKIKVLNERSPISKKK